MKTVKIEETTGIGILFLVFPLAMPNTFINEVKDHIPTGKMFNNINHLFGLAQGNDVK